MASRDYASPGYVESGYVTDRLVDRYFDVRNTIISQYANSPTLLRLIEAMEEYFDPSANFQAFYDYVWNIRTAQGWGLDILGRIVGASRQLEIPATLEFFGFNQTSDFQPFGQAPFFNGPKTSNTYSLSDDAYRTLILMKALLNISDCSAPSINRLLSSLFEGRGRCYVADDGDMQIRFVFEFALTPYEVAILTRSNAIPKPAAVSASITYVTPDSQTVTSPM